MTMWALRFSLLFGAIYTHPWRGSLGSDCLLRDGRVRSVGRCIPSAQCPRAYPSQTAIRCRYSRGYDLRICCDYKNIFTPVTERDDLFSDEQPILFPSDLNPTYSQYYPLTKPIPSYNKPFFVSNSDYDSQNVPIYNEKLPYTGDFTDPSIENSRPNYEFENPATSSAFQKRLPVYRPQTTSWVYEKTTPRPTWSVEDPNSKTGVYQTYKRISHQKCEDYSKPLSQTIDVLPLSIGAESTPFKIEKCEFSAVKLIVGGEPSQAGEFPHMAALGFWAAGLNKVVWNCGGTLISELYVMTAGHCVNTSNGNPVVVRLGEINLATNDDGAEPVDIGIQRVVIHPKYYKSLKYNDIALIRLSRSVKFNKWIRPACLPNNNNNEDIFTETPTAIGWGRSEFAGKLSDVLMKVNLDIVDNRQCNEFYNTDNPGSSSFSSGIVDTMICAGELRGGKDTCLGDSGGPLTISKKNNPCIHYVIGITSFGKICGAPNSPGVYTRVSKYLSWIENNVWSE